MRDAFGGLMNMVIIIVFLVLVSGYLAFNVNYTKAYRVKNKIITTIEQYEGNCDNINDACNQTIAAYMHDIGYSTQNNLRIEGYDCDVGLGYCKRIHYAATNTSDRAQRVYYDVVTAIVVDVPIINKIMPNLKLFQVYGSTTQFVPYNAYD